MFAFTSMKMAGMKDLPNNPSLMLCAVCRLLLTFLCNAITSVKDLFLLTVGLLFATWLMCYACLTFSSFPLFEYLSIFLFLCVCVFRKRQQSYWAPTHKLSTLDTQRRMLSLIRPTQRTVRPPPPPLSLLLTLYAAQSLFFCFFCYSSCTVITVVLFYILKEWVILWLIWYAVCLDFTESCEEKGQMLPNTTEWTSLLLVCCFYIIQNSIAAVYNVHWK